MLFSCTGRLASMVRVIAPWPEPSEKENVTGTVWAGYSGAVRPVSRTLAPSGLKPICTVWPAPISIGVLEEVAGADEPAAGLEAPDEAEPLADAEAEAEPLADADAEPEPPADAEAEPASEPLADAESEADAEAPSPAMEPETPFGPAWLMTALVAAGVLTLVRVTLLGPVLMTTNCSSAVPPLA